MPKIIEGLREEILRAARARLLAEGWQAFNVRSLARDCGVSVGTIYDYYPSKGALLANVMGRDWREMLDGVRDGEYGSAEEALQALYEGIGEFVDRYRPALSRYVFSPRETPDFAHGHRMVICQLAAVVSVILRPFRAEDDPELARFISDALLSHSRFGDCPYERIGPYIRKLLE